MAARNNDVYKKNYRFLMMTIWPDKVRLTDLTLGLARMSRLLWTQGPGLVDPTLLR